MKPLREPARNNSQTYFVTSQTWERRSLFQNRQWAEIFIETLFHYRGPAYLLHEFVLMPDHFHLLITPATSLEKAMQFIKGGFSRRRNPDPILKSGKEVLLTIEFEISEDYQKHVRYIHLNPVRKHLCSVSNDYPYSSAFLQFNLDPVPQWLKPHANMNGDGTAEAVPLQNKTKIKT